MVKIAPDLLINLALEKTDCLTDCMLHMFNAVFNTLSLRSRPVHLSSCPSVLVTSTLHNILSKPLDAFSHNSRRKNRQQYEREMNPVAMTLNQSV